jgi:peptide/nickel transport system ATP-binding protein
MPGWSEVTSGHQVKCHLFDQDNGSRVPSSVKAVEGASQRGSVLQSDCAIPELLRVTDLKVYFPIQKGLIKRVVGHVKAVDGVSLTIPRGGTLALVGESGCGKTTVGKGILQLIRPTAGSVLYDGLELVGLERRQLREKRAEFQIIFQDPYSSLNPRMRIVDIIEEGMNALNVRDKPVSAGYKPSSSEGWGVDTLLQRVGLPPETKWRYPHEFSGGQRQRIAIARALAVNPRLLICDEPTSALDVSVQAQILNLLKELQNGLGLSYLFITHNISVVEYLADEVAVMYLGRIVERGSMDEVMGSPQHPYTQALLSAVPVIEPDLKREVIRLHGDLPSPANPPAGCHFHPRCPQVMPVCHETYPEASSFSSTHMARCHLYTQNQRAVAKSEFLEVPE